MTTTVVAVTWMCLVALKLLANIVRLGSEHPSYVERTNRADIALASLFQLAILIWIVCVLLA